MHAKILLIDENYKNFGRDPKKWLENINKQIDKYYTDNSFCDYASIGVDNILFCKPSTGYVIKDDKLELAPDSFTITQQVPVKTPDGEEAYSLEIVELKNCCHICDIKDLTKINDEYLWLIEFSHPKTQTSYGSKSEIIDKLNKKQIQGTIITLDIHR